LTKIKATVDGNDLTVQATKPCELKLKFFFTDLEFLVSKDPFLSSEMKNFIYVRPNACSNISED
jgi:hypothetical protein